MEGDGAQRPCLRVIEPKMTGARSARARRAFKPTTYMYNIVGQRILFRLFATEDLESFSLNEKPEELSQLG